MKKYILYITFLALIVSACDLKEDYVVEKSKVVDAAGQWWINYKTTGYESGYYALKTYNTSADDGKEFWITDDGEWWDYKVKCPINIDAMTFSGKDLANTAYDIKVQIVNGKIIKNGGKSTSGVVVDSIYFELEFEDDPGTIYKAGGHRRTGFLEDEH